MIKDKRNTVLGIIVAILLISGVFVKNIYYDLFVNLSYITFTITLIVPRKQKLTPAILRNWLEDHLKKDVTQITMLCSMLMKRSINISGADRLIIDADKNKLIYATDKELIKRLDKVIEDFDNEKIS